MGIAEQESYSSPHLSHAQALYAVVVPHSRTVPTSEHRNLATRVNEAIQQNGGRAYLESDTTIGRYTLYRILCDPRVPTNDGRLHFLLRVTTLRSTGQIIEVRGSYAEDEADRLARQIPADVVTPARAIKIASDATEAGGSRNFLPPSRSEIDLIAGQFYVVRLPARMPQTPRKLGDLSPDYFITYVIDAKSGAILSQQLGTG